MMMVSKVITNHSEKGYIKAVPISTCTPWNPVEKKNVDLYTPSAIVNPAFVQYLEKLSIE
jgi:hypothetical protein